MKSKILNNKGITLIEVIAVIAIFSLVIILTIPNINNGGENAKQKLLDTKIESIESAAVVYGQDNKNKFNSKCDAVGEACYGIDNCYCYDESITVWHLANKNVLNTDRNSDDIINPVTKKTMLNDYVQIYKKYNKIYAIYNQNDYIYTEKPDGSIIATSPEPTEPELIPELPNEEKIIEEKEKELITFNYGTFETKTNYKPATYQEITIFETKIKTKEPIKYYGGLVVGWELNNEYKVVAVPPKLSDIGKNHANYIVYELNKDAGYVSGVSADGIRYSYAQNKEEDTLENILYLTAYLNHSDNGTRRIAKWNGVEYVDDNEASSKIANITDFTESYVVEKKQNVLIEEASTTTEYVYIPKGTYKAPIGMTWDEWLNSKYNVRGSSNLIIKDSKNQDILHDEIINENSNYSFIGNELVGKWKWNDEIIADNVVVRQSQQRTYVYDFIVKYKINGQNFNEIRILSYSLDYSVDYSLDKIHIWYMNEGEHDYLTVELLLNENGKYSINVEDEGFKIIDFGDDGVTVPNDFYEWFIVNATKIRN